LLIDQLDFSHRLINKGNEMQAAQSKTVSRAALIQMAVSLERSALDALPARKILGQAQKSLDELDQAAAIRRAAAVRSIKARRELLRDAGVQA
jgi:hypothetical protein